jgi:hypothetical protein
VGSSQKIIVSERDSLSNHCLKDGGVWHFCQKLNRMDLRHSTFCYHRLLFKSRSVPPIHSIAVEFRTSQSCPDHEGSHSCVATTSSVRISCSSPVRASWERLEFPNIFHVLFDAALKKFQPTMYRCRCLPTNILNWYSCNQTFVYYSHPNIKLLKREVIPTTGRRKCWSGHSALARNILLSPWWKSNQKR